MYKFTIQKNTYLNQNTKAYYHTDYLRMGMPGNPDYVNYLKNTFNNFPNNILNNSVKELEKVLSIDLIEIFNELNFESLTVGVVPRAKARYHANQLLFKTTVSNIVNSIPGLVNGTDYILRHTDTQTTHLGNSINNNNGSRPYEGITNDTCMISNKVRDKNILLIDDIYTTSINIDEDAIQALLDNGAKSVTFYAIGKTR